MKKPFFYIKTLAFIFLIIIYSCDKNDELKNYEACTNLISKSPNDDLVSTEKKELAEHLFTINEIDYVNLQITKVQKDEMDNYHVRCNQFINGLQIFTSDIIFHFNKNGEFYGLSGDLVDNISLNNQSDLGIDILKNKYLNEVQNDIFYKSEIGEIIENCLDLQFGYFDLNAGISYQPLKIVKAWKITPHDKEFPKLYVNDNTSENIYYDDGIIVN